LRWRILYSQIGACRASEKNKKAGELPCDKNYYGEYAAPLGVWVTREASRKTFENKPISFSSKEEMINYTKDFILRRFGINIENCDKGKQSHSRIDKQRKLSSFF
jgi:hypothetical protein